VCTVDVPAVITLYGAGFLLLVGAPAGIAFMAWRRATGGWRIAAALASVALALLLAFAFPPRAQPTASIAAALFVLAALAWLATKRRPAWRSAALALAVAGAAGLLVAFGMAFEACPGGAVGVPAAASRSVF
jgi:hypothetical protein